MKERNYGLDLLRILSMCGIIGLHVINAGGVLKSYDFSCIPVEILNILAMASVNIFAMLTGYLYINRKIKYKSIIELIMITIFWCITISIATRFMFPQIFIGIKMYVMSLFPPLFGRYWYLTSYVFLFFCIPYINILLNTLTSKQRKKLLITLFVFLSVITTFLKTDFFKVSDGYSPIWLIFCYCIGAHMCLDRQLDLSKKNLTIMLITLILCLLGICKFGTILIYRLFDKTIILSFLINYNSPFIVIESILVFLIFRSLKVKNNYFRKIYLNLSNSAFEVYIIHSHYLIFDYVITNNFSFLKSYGLFGTVLGILLAIISIYLTCSMLSEIRKVFFKIFKVSIFSERVGENIHKYL